MAAADHASTAEPRTRAGRIVSSGWPVVCSTEYWLQKPGSSAKRLLAETSPEAASGWPMVPVRVKRGPATARAPPLSIVLFVIWNRGSAWSAEAVSSMGVRVCMSGKRMCGLRREFRRSRGCGREARSFRFCFAVGLASLGSLLPGSRGTARQLSDGTMKRLRLSILHPSRFVSCAWALLPRTMPQSGRLGEPQRASP